MANDLPSKVDETFAACPQFRIVVIGNTGVGKSSLVSSVFNISLSDIDIAHDRTGKANIEHEYTSDQNPRFILHDSLGFEHGSTTNWKIIEDFLRDRSAKQLKKDQVHAIWLCIEAPREGSRLQQIGDEELLSLAQELNITVVIVFTKYDILINEEWIKAVDDEIDLSEVELERNAEASFDVRVKGLKASTSASIVKVSTRQDYIHTLRNLTDVTRKGLHDVEGDLWIPWATAQQISARQKVELSISEGLKQYWMNLGSSVIFERHTLIDCVWRIHDDIVKVWNFNDRNKLLSKEIFLNSMLKLVENLLPESEIQQSNWLSQAANMATIGGAIPNLGPILFGAGMGAIALQSLYGKYRKIPWTGQYLSAYIVDLVCILHRIFMETLSVDPPRELSEELISGVVETYKMSDSDRIHRTIQGMPFGFEDKIASLIRKSLRMDME